MSSLKRFAGKVLRALPDDGKAIKTSVRKMLVRKDLAIGKLSQRIVGATLPDPRTRFHIDPRRIEYVTCMDNGSSDWEDWVLPQRGRVKAVQAGDWDLLQHEVSEMRICAAVEARVKQGADWSTSEFYRTAVRQIESGRTLWGCSSRTDVDAHCAGIDRLIESISRDGYRDNEMPPSEVRMDTALGQSEVLVSISRDGYPLFQDGRHRLAIARALGLQRIPVQVFSRHADWQTFREFVHRIARSSGGASKAGFLYQQAAHFDLADIPAEHNCEDRWEAIEPHLPAGLGRALDIGCNLGFICHRLEELGYAAVGVEYLPDIAYAARRIAKAELRQFEVVTGDVRAESTLREVGSLRFEVVMALNIFHHFIKTEAGFNGLRDFMGRLTIGTMFFEPHQPDDPQMQGVFANPSADEFAALMKEWGRFQNVTPIYRAVDGRVVYRLGR